MGAPIIVVAEGLSRIVRRFINDLDAEWLEIERIKDRDMPLAEWNDRI
jgi:16S rRNA U516 pseudouridylate synthase RsuA-like enzyme